MAGRWTHPRSHITVVVPVAVARCYGYLRSLIPVVVTICGLRWVATILRCCTTFPFDTFMADLRLPTLPLDVRVYSPGNCDCPVAFTLPDHFGAVTTTVDCELTHGCW